MVQHSVWLLPDFQGANRKSLYIYIGEDDSLNIYEHSVAVLQYLLLKLPEQTENSNPVARVPLPQGSLTLHAKKSQDNGWDEWKIS